MPRYGVHSRTKPWGSAESIKTTNGSTRRSRSLAVLSRVNPLHDLRPVRFRVAIVAQEKRLPRVVHDPRHHQCRWVQRNIGAAFATRADRHPPAIDEHHPVKPRHQHRYVDVKAGDAIPGTVVQQILTCAKNLPRDFDAPVPPPFRIDLRRHDQQALIEQNRGVGGSRSERPTATLLLAGAIELPRTEPRKRRRWP